MATFTGTSGNDIANAANGTLTGFTGGTITELQDGIGDTFNANNGLDTIIAASGADTINGGGGDDFIAGRGGADSIDGGTGFDFISYELDAAAGGGAAVNVNLSTGQATDGFGSTDTLVLNTIEAVRGTAFADTFTGSNRTDDSEHFQGLAGNDTINGLGGFDEVRYDRDATSGGAGAVTVNLTTGFATDGFGNTDMLSNIEAVRGTAQADSITGSDRTDTTEQFRGLAGNDTINGAGGTDEIRYDSDAGAGGGNGVTVNLATGIAIDGFGNTDSLSNIENIRATAFNDNLTGDANNNTFIGFAGTDTINGGNGFDLINYFNENSGGVAIIANLSTGFITDTTGATDTVSNIEEIRTGNLADSITGSNVGESFSGNGGNDTFVGGGGRDFMRGGTGNDRLDGTAGSGTFADMSSGDSDTAGYNDSGITQGVVVNLNTGTATDGFGNTDTLIDIERVRGTSFADTITGSNTANLRNERFEGLGGSDSIDGQAGYDVMAYNNDINNGGGAGVTVNLNTGVATDGFGATDNLQNIEGIFGTVFNDSLTGSAANNTFRTYSGNDIIDGLGGEDTLELYFDDQIGTAGAVVSLASNSGTNTMGGTLTLTDIEHIDGSYRNDTLTGSTGANNLSGSLGNDSLDGGDGDDTINGGSGADTMIGGIGNDWLSYSFDTTDPVQNGIDSGQIAATLGWTTQNWNWTGVVVNLTFGTNYGLDGAKDTFSGFENIAGTYYNDWLTGDTQNNWFRGFAGSDTIDGGAGSDTVTYAANFSRTSGLAINLMVGDNPNGISTNLATSFGSDGNGGTDRLLSIENVIGSTGADSITGSDAVNTLTGGDGNDTIVSNSGADIITGGIGTDTFKTGLALAAINVSGAAGAYTFTSVLTGETMTVNEMESYDFAGIVTAAPATMVFNVVGGATAGADVLVSGATDDLVDGLAGNDTIFTQGGNDRVFGGSENDVAALGTGDDAVFGGDGDDFFYGGEGNDAMGGGNGADVLLGEAGDDVILGGANNDYIFGGSGSNYLEGNDGADVFISEGTNDTIFGGNGDDFYYIGGNGTFINGGAGVDQFIGGAVNSNDVFIGGDDGDYAYGGDGNDELIGGDGGDVLIGQNGNDTIDGGSGVNLIWCNDVGNDQVRVNVADQGTQIIDFFEAGGTNDSVRLIGSGLNSFADFQNLVTNYGTAVNGNMVVNTASSGILYLNLGANQSAVWFQGVSVFSLTAADFTFG
jgi:Ca2+-binding RTX toxin-like protein